MLGVRSPAIDRQRGADLAVPRRNREIDAALRHQSPSRSAAQHESDRREKRHHMTILDKLRADHRESVALLATIMAAGDEQQRNILFDQFVQEFVAQTRAEEKEFYEVLRSYDDSRYLSLYAEQARELAISLANNLAEDQHKATELWTAQCQVLKTMLEQHIREEEDVIFRLAKEIFDNGTLRRMGSQFSEEKKKHLR
jgi:hemerythrin-like domain-containing protein